MKSIFLFSCLFLLNCDKNPRPSQTPSLDVSDAGGDTTVEVVSEQTESIPSYPCSPESIPSSPPPLCPSDMVHIEKYNYCIDRFEAPNREGVEPFAAQTALQAENYCQEAGKNLCTQEQWMTACQGPHHKNYPYGNVYKRGTCNDDKAGWVPVPWLTMGTPAWTKFCQEQYKGEPSGNRTACVSDDGVYDLTGNVAEWVREPKSYWGYVVKGGYWYGVYGQGVTPSCGFVNAAHSPTFQSYEFGFRCCKNAN